MRFECGYSGTTESPSWHINGIPFFVTELWPPYSYYDSSLIISSVTAAMNNSVYNCFFDIHIISNDATLVILPYSDVAMLPRSCTKFATPRHTLLTSICKDTSYSFDSTGSSMTVSVKITSVTSHHNILTTPIHIVPSSDVSMNTVHFSTNKCELDNNVYILKHNVYFQ